MSTQGLRWVWIALLVTASFGQVVEGQGEDRLTELEKRLLQQEEENTTLRRQMETMERQIFDLIDGGGAAVAPGAGDANDDGSQVRSLPEIADELSSRSGGSFRGGLYDKPFLSNLANRTYLGGYIDLEYRDVQGSDRTFRQHRLIPFIYSQISEQLRFAAEIEFEDGGPDTPQGDGEVKIEFATLDYVPDEAFGIRAGAILVPLGKFNLIHDSPVNDLTDRPMVSRLVIPSTLTESGVGIFGTLYPGDESKLDYELYLVNGFQGLESNGMGGFTSNFSSTGGLRSGRASLKADNNNSVAGVGRLTYSPFIGVEVGGSAHVGKYDDRGENDLVIVALDGSYQQGPFEILGEIARAEISRNTLARASGVPDDMWGYYLQCNMHFMPESFRECCPTIFRAESTFTGVVRVGHVELDNNRMERLTFGLNFRPEEQAVFKFDYQINFNDWNAGRANDAFLFSVASYF